MDNLDVGTAKDTDVESTDADEAFLKSLGYKQDLSRSLSPFSNFSVAFGCVSILSGLTPLWGVALQSGGPLAVIWGWLIVAFLTMFIGLSLAEICSAFPTTGGLYFWTSRLADREWAPLACWMTGWFNFLGLCFAIASTDLSLAQFIASAVSIAQPDISIDVYHIFAIYTGILLLHGLLNSVAIRWNGLFNQASVWWHIFGTLFIVIVCLVTTSKNRGGLASPSFVFGNFENYTGWSNGGYAFLLGLLQSQYTLSGYDSAAHMSEETKTAQRGSPMGILMSIIVASVVGWIFLLATTFSITDFQNQIVSPTVGLAMSQVFLDSAGVNLAMVMIAIIIGAQFFCGSALTLGSSRMVYAFARDGALPFSKYLHSLNPRTRSPVIAVWFNIAISFIVGIPFMFSSQIFSAIISVNTIASSISYLIPILLRITIARKTFIPGIAFNMGRWSTPVGIISCLWILLTSILFLCPTQYPVTTSNVNYAAAPFILVIGLSSGYYAIWGRKWFKGPKRNVIMDEYQKPAVAGDGEMVEVISEEK